MIFLDAERFIRQAIESVLAQTFRDWELLLVDDGSTDSSTDIAKEFSERHSAQIRYVDHPAHQNHGMSASRNRGVELAKGEFVAFIDADDVWVSFKLAEQIRVMQKHPELAMVCGSPRYWSSWEGGEDRIVPTGHQRDRVVLPPEAALTLYPLGKAAAPCPSDLLIRRDTVISVGGFEEEFVGPLQLYEDQAFLAKIYLAAPVYFASQTWLNYRQHSSSCVATVQGDGLYDHVRHYFLEWFEEYTRARATDPRVTAMLREARSQRGPASLARRVGRRLDRIRRGAQRRLTWQGPRVSKSKST